MSDIINILRKNHAKKTGGLSLCENLNKEVIAVVQKNKKQKYICNSENSDKKAIEIPSDDYAIVPHVPLSKERYIIFCSGESGMGKSSLTSLFIKQTHANITKRIFYICGTDIKADINLKPLKYINQIPGEYLSEIDVEKDLKDSLIVFDDIDNWEHHKEAVKILNKAYETGRKFGINIIYISHIASAARESKIYGEVSMYITNKVKNNRMIEYHLGMNKQQIEELDDYLKTDPFVCYNKIYDSIVTDKKVFKLSD